MLDTKEHGCYAPEHDATNPDVSGKILAQAHQAIKWKFQSLRVRQEARDGRLREQQAFTDGLIRRALGAEAPRTTNPSLDVTEVLTVLRERNAHTVFVQSPQAKARVLRPFSNLRDGVVDADLQLVGVNSDTKLEILGPPYANAFALTGKSGSGAAQASATRADGKFDFIHGAGSGGG